MTNLPGRLAFGRSRAGSLPPLGHFPLLSPTLGRGRYDGERELDQPVDERNERQKGYEGEDPGHPRRQLAGDDSVARSQDGNHRHHADRSSQDDGHPLVNGRKRDWLLS